MIMFEKIGGLFGKKKPKPFEPTVPTGNNDKVWYANVDPRTNVNLELANVRVRKIGESEPVPVVLGSPDYLAPISNLKSTTTGSKPDAWAEEIKEVVSVSDVVREEVFGVEKLGENEQDDAEGDFFSGGYDPSEWEDEEGPSDEDNEPEFDHVVMGPDGEIMGDLDIGADEKVIPNNYELVNVDDDVVVVEPQPVAPLVENISEEVRKVLDRRELAFMAVERALNRIRKLKDGDSTFKLRLSMLSLTLKEYEDTRRSLLEDPDEVEVDFLHSEVIEEAYAWVERGTNGVA